MEIVGFSAVPRCSRSRAAARSRRRGTRTSMSYCGRLSSPPYRRSAKTRPLSWSAGIPCCDRLLASSSNASSSSVGSTARRRPARLDRLDEVGRQRRPAVRICDRPEHETDEVMPTERVGDLGWRLLHRRARGDDSVRVVLADPERELGELGPEGHAAFAVPATAGASKHGTARTSARTTASNWAGACCAVPGR